MRLLLVLLVLVPAAVLRADVVQLVNGDRLTGTIKSMEGGKMVLASELAGEVTLDMSAVRTFETTEPLSLHLAGGNVLQTRTLAAEADRQVQVQSDLVDGAVDLERIEAINPAEKPAVVWNGYLNVGAVSTHGNTRTESFQMGAQAQRRTEDTRLTLSSDYAKARQEDATGDMETTEDWWKSRGKYDLFLSEKLYAFVEGRYETDEIALLDYRMIGGGGLGYQWIETDRTKFGTELGAAYLYEKFDNATGSNDDVTLQAGYNLEHQLTDTVKFINNLTWYPAFDDFGDYYLTTTGELRASLTERMFANFRTIFDYDRTPAQGVGNTDVKYILGVGWEF